MATNEPTVSGDVPLETDDDLSHEQLSKYVAQTNITDYVVRGMGFSVDFGADTVDIGTTTTRGNFAVAVNDNKAFYLFPDQATGVSLHASTTNHIWVAYDEPNNKATDVYYHVDDDDSAPTDPSVKIGTIDTSADTSTELNRAADVTAAAATVTGHLDLQDTNRQTLSGNLTLAATDAMIQNIDPAGARDVTLPAESDGLVFVVGNRADASEAITLKNDAGTTLATVNQDDVAYCVSDGTGWLVFAAAGGVT